MKIKQVKGKNERAAEAVATLSKENANLLLILLIYFVFRI